MELIRFTDIQGIKVGHEQDMNAGTGCTVILCEEGATAGVDVRGGSPGTRETDLLNPVNMIEKIHGVLLSGGSAFGLDAASGIMQYLEEKNIGFNVGVTRVPIVAGAVLFDLNCGDFRIRPDKEMGYRACKNSNNCENLSGCIGAGTGATIGKILGVDYAMKGGLGTCTVKAGELMVGAIVAVNCLGDVVDPSNGQIIAGALKPNKETFANTEEIMIHEAGSRKNAFNSNTTIGVIATNALLTKAQATKVSSMAHNGYGRTIRPAHSMFDGDTIFTLSTGQVAADVNVVGLLAARMMEQAVVDAVKSAVSLYGFKCYSDIK